MLRSLVLWRITNGTKRNCGSYWLPEINSTLFLFRPAKRHTKQLTNEDSAELLEPELSAHLRSDDAASRGASRCTHTARTSVIESGQRAWSAHGVHHVRVVLARVSTSSNRSELAHSGTVGVRVHQLHRVRLTDSVSTARLRAGIAQGESRAEQESDACLHIVRVSRVVPKNEKWLF